MSHQTPGLSRYPRILGICWRAAVSTELQYRANFVTGIVVSLFWMVWAAVGVLVYFQFAGQIAGWNYPELLAVIGLFFALNGLRQAVLQPNLERMTDYVQRGTLDFLLTKPVDAQLLVSLRQLNVGNLPDPLLGLALSAGGVVASGHRVTWGDAGAFVLALGSSVLLLYALMLALMALAVHLVGADELDSLSFAAVELARFPVDFYRDPVRTVLTVIPVALLTTVPAQAILGRLDAVTLTVTPAAAVGCLALAIVLWRHALRRYSGASS